MTLRMSIPIETETRFPSLTLWSQARRFGRLFFRSLWRSGVTPLLPLVIAFGVWYTRLLVGDGVVLWHEVSISIAMIYAIIGPLCAGLVAWTSGRPHRRHMDDHLASMAIGGWQRDALTFATAAGIGVIGYGATALAIMGWAATQATWGSPYGTVMLSGLSMVVLFCLFGAAIGMMWPSHFAALLVAAITGGSVAWGNTIQNWGTEANARELTLWNSLLSLRDGFGPWTATRTTPVLFEVMLTAAGLSAVVVTLVLVVRYREPIAMVALVLAVIWAFAGILMTTGGERSTPIAGWMASETTASFEYACNDQGVVEVCLHPAWTSVQSLVDEMAIEIYTPIAGLQGVPERIVQVSSYDPDARGDGTFYMPSGRITHPNLGYVLVGTVFPGMNGNGKPVSDAELAIAGWLLEESGGSVQMLHLVGPRYDASAVTRQQAIHNAADRFSVLSPEEQRAWLETNWDTLRAGELTLEDLP